MRQVTAKLDKMRKPQTFTVYPPSDDGQIIVQSDRAIGKFDPATGKGMLNYAGSTPKYFPHLTATLGAKPFTFPDWFIKECVASQPTSKIVVLGDDSPKTFTIIDDTNETILAGYKDIPDTHHVLRDGVPNGSGQKFYSDLEVGESTRYRWTMPGTTYGTIKRTS
jgi:hypothetical protein